MGALLRRRSHTTILPKGEDEMQIHWGWFLAAFAGVFIIHAVIRRR